MKKIQLPCLTQLLYASLYHVTYLFFPATSHRAPRAMHRATRITDLFVWESG